MSSSTDNKTLIYDTIKTLNTPTKDSKTDFYNNDDEDFYVPDSFSAFFGGVISEQDIQDAINQLEQEKQKDSEKKEINNHTESSTASDEENDGIFNRIRKFIKI
ncbi:hypothetical protein C1645_802392 [Glomus cerebriforme]|uniref:Uncharacterized protein n=1 Tax=Glomus cerebriforme TaxID=658196 RepID=A0A397TEZ5_9GLOM|nr:hypothetical protein C1645_802392 [Glomus cerebriforme]